MGRMEAEPLDTNGAKKDPQVELARQLVARLERLSADSYWAHQASGIRGALLRALERIERGSGDPANTAQHLQALNDAGFAMLVKAAQERVARKAAG